MSDTYTKEEALKAIEKGAEKGILHALGLDFSYMFNAREQVAFRKEITDAIERGVCQAMMESDNRRLLKADLMGLLTDLDVMNTIGHALAEEVQRRTHQIDNSE